LQNLRNFFPVNLVPFVGDDRVGDPEAINDVGEEHYSFL
jgi:hypothetical protein